MLLQSHILQYNTIPNFIPLEKDKEGECRSENIGWRVSLSLSRGEELGTIENSTISMHDFIIRLHNNDHCKAATEINSIDRRTTQFHCQQQDIPTLLDTSFSG